MYLFIDGKKYCDASISPGIRVQYHIFGQSASIGSDVKVILKLSKPLATRLDDCRIFELRHNGERRRVYPIGGTSPRDGTIETMLGDVQSLAQTYKGCTVTLKYDQASRPLLDEMIQVLRDGLQGVDVIIQAGNLKGVDVESYVPTGHQIDSAGEVDPKTGKLIRQMGAELLRLSAENMISPLLPVRK